MKKQHRKLALNRETLRLLDPRLQWIRGGQEQLNSGEPTCGFCDSNLSCSAQTEDCCVTTMVQA